jgi:hypothetical protein
MIKYFSFLIKFFKKEKNKKINLVKKRKKVDNESIRLRIESLGWKLIEIPIKSKDPKNKKTFISKWKIIASRNDKSLEVGGKDINEALKNIGITLGVISKE